MATSASAVGTSSSPGSAAHNNSNKNNNVTISAVPTPIPAYATLPPSAATATTTNELPATNPSSGVPFGYLPAYLPGSASLVEQLDRRLLIVLRDGRHLVGVLRSFDQFSNFVVEDASERRILRRPTSTSSPEGDDDVVYFTDVRLGLFLVRGDSVVLLGEVDERVVDGDDDHDDDRAPPPRRGTPRMKRLSPEEFERASREQDEEEEQRRQKMKWDFDTDLAV